MIYGNIKPIGLNYTRLVNGYVIAKFDSYIYKKMTMHIIDLNFFISYSIILYYFMSISSINKIIYFIDGIII